jgi:signal transduction histidine kinase
MAYRAKGGSSVVFNPAVNVRRRMLAQCAGWRVGYSMADVSLTVNTKQLRLQIKDDGRGIPQKRLRSLIEGAAEAGVGLAGMRERVRELGGSLEIRSDRGGTRVVISIPVKSTSDDSQKNGGSGRAA